MIHASGDEMDQTEMRGLGGEGHGGEGYEEGSVGVDGGIDFREAFPGSGAVEEVLVCDRYVRVVLPYSMEDRGGLVEGEDDEEVLGFVDSAAHFRGGWCYSGGGLLDTVQ